MKFSLTLVLLYTSTVSFTQSPIFPSLQGADLLTALEDTYKPVQLMDYGPTRDSMYWNVYRDSDGFVECFYTGHKIFLPDGVDPSAFLYDNENPNGITAEHIYPQSKGARFGNAKSDIHSLVPCIWRANEARSNYPFKDIPDNDTDHWYRFTEELQSVPTMDIDDYSERLNGSFGPGEFEPRESVKGDVARAVFYFYTIYKEEADSADDDYFESMKQTLIDWHHADLPDNREIELTNLRATQQEDKPNPYVLDCTLVSRAFGDSNGCQPSRTTKNDYRPKRYVYPNPVDRSLSLYGMRDDATSLKITTLEGEVIQTINKLLTWEIDVSGYMAGVYLVSLYKDGTHIETLKWVKG